LLTWACNSQCPQPAEADIEAVEYKGFPHGMPTTETETINADLLAFIKG
jgi:hypothetical protein